MSLQKRRRYMIAPLLTAFLLIMSPFATAEEPADAISGKGMITAPDKITLLAPMGGQMKDFSWKPGDQAEEGVLALEVLPSHISAANSGVIKGLHAQINDQASAVITQYGALCYVERQGIWHVHASTASAYDKPKNRDISIGDVLRVRKGSGDNEKSGEGSVISIDGKSFVLEMERGDFQLEDDVSLYLGTGSTFKSSDLVGKGNVVRPQALKVTGEGVVASVLIKEGDTVERGQTLFLMDSPSARFVAQAGSPQVIFPQASLIESILVSPGQNVMQGQELMTLIPENVLEATLEIDELDIAKVQVGQFVRLVIDAFPGAEREGVIREIRPLGKTQLDTTKFDVRVSIGNTQDLLLGMHVTGYVGQ